MAFHGVQPRVRAGPATSPNRVGSPAARGCSDGPARRVSALECRRLPRPSSGWGAISPKSCSLASTRRARSCAPRPWGTTLSAATTWWWWNALATPSATTASSSPCAAPHVTPRSAPCSSPGGIASPMSSRAHHAFAGCDHGRPGSCWAHATVQPPQLDTAGGPVLVRLRGLSRRRPARLGPPSRLPNLWPHRLLRQFTRASRDEALPRHCASSRTLLRARRGLVLVLP